jgi:hypothetical protein
VLISSLSQPVPTWGSPLTGIIAKQCLPVTADGVVLSGQVLGLGCCLLFCCCVLCVHVWGGGGSWSLISTQFSIILLPVAIVMPHVPDPKELSTPRQHH